MKQLVSLLIGAIIITLMWGVDKASDYRIIVKQDSAIAADSLKISMYQALYLECNGKISKVNKDSSMFVK